MKNSKHAKGEQHVVALTLGIKAETVLRERNGELYYIPRRGPAFAVRLGPTGKPWLESDMIYLRQKPAKRGILTPVEFCRLDEVAQETVAKKFYKCGCKVCYWYGSGQAKVAFCKHWLSLKAMPGRLFRWGLRGPDGELLFRSSWPRRVSVKRIFDSIYWRQFVAEAPRRPLALAAFAAQPAVPVEIPSRYPEHLVRKDNRK